MSATLPSLDQLQDLPLPAPVSYWPQTWGWGVLLAIVIIAVAVGGWCLLRRHRRNRYRREALQLLDAIEEQASADRQAARGLPELLKRVGISASPAQAAAIRNLRGQAWVDFLRRTGKRNFPDDTAALLVTLAYAPASDVMAISPTRLRDLFAASRHWIEDHHVAA